MCIWQTSIIMKKKFVRPETGGGGLKELYVHGAGIFLGKWIDDR